MYCRNLYIIDLISNILLYKYYVYSIWKYLLGYAYLNLFSIFAIGVGEKQYWNSWLLPWRVQLGCHLNQHCCCYSSDFQNMVSTSSENGRGISVLSNEKDLFISILFFAMPLSFFSLVYSYSLSRHPVGPFSSGGTQDF